MDQPDGLDAARHAFVDAVTRYDGHAPELTQEAAETLAKSICKLSNICTNANIQRSKELTLADLLISPSRTAALKEYMLTLSKSFCPRDLDARVDTTKPGDENEGLGKIVSGKVQQPPQPAFKRLHLLHLLHDVMMSVHKHAGYYESYDSAQDKLQQLQPLASTLARLAVCGYAGKATATQDAVLDMVAIWKDGAVLSSLDCDDIEGLVRDSSALGWTEVLDSLADEYAKTRSKGVIEGGFDWVLPYRHSNIDDPNAPWHELPAANGLYMKRTRGFPMRAVAFPNRGYEIEGAGYRADDELKQEVTALYKDMVRCHEKFTDADDVQDVDALGNVVWKDADRPTRNYWGWTLDGIDTRRDLAVQFAEDARGYADLPPVRPAGVNSAVERAKALAAERSGGSMAGTDGFDMGGNGMADIRGRGFDMARGGFRGGDRGGFRGGYRGAFRGGHRGRARW